MGRSSSGAWSSWAEHPDGRSATVRGRRAGGAPAALTAGSPLSRQAVGAGGEKRAHRETRTAVQDITAFQQFSLVKIVQPVVEVVEPLVEPGVELFAKGKVALGEGGTDRRH